jgi:hypothetical protein
MTSKGKVGAPTCTTKATMARKKNQSGTLYLVHIPEHPSSNINRWYDPTGI